MHQNNKKGSIGRSALYFVLFLTSVFVLAQMSENNGDDKESIEIDRPSFIEMANSGLFSEVVLTEDLVIGYSESSAFIYPDPIDESLILLLSEKGIPFSFLDSQESFPGSTWTLLAVLIAPTILLVMAFRIAKKEQREENTSFKNIFEASSSAKRIRAESDTGIRFGDIAGEDECKYELEEIVDYLLNGEKYRSMGAKLPKGCLLVGPPGTGKTLLAKAVAGEAKVPFFKTSGADFVEMYVGVGASRIRELFANAREKSPAIIFIDEIDAIGKVRGHSQLSGNDEREQTLNQLLVEMDGFDSKEGIIVIAATNRPEILDPALLRAGRFDRQIHVDKPDMKGRLDILRIHTRKLKLDETVDLTRIARISGGLSGADLANIANEAALLAVRRKHDRITHIDFEEALEKSVAGLERKSRVLSEKERRRIAFHETGHALTAYLTKGADPVSKISIIPRGGQALGYTMQTPTEDRALLSKSELIASIDVLLGGRAAEDVIYGEISTGASNDIARATSIARDMIGLYGMSEVFKNMALLSNGQGGYESIGPRQYSEATQECLDKETASIIQERYLFVRDNLAHELNALSEIAGKLMENEVLEENEFRSLASSLLNKRLS